MKDLTNYQIQDKDTWNIDYTLAHLLERLFDRFIEKGTTIPCDMIEEKWEAILVEIRDGFKSYRQYLDTEFTTSDITQEETEKAAQKAFFDVQRSLELLKTYYTALWW